MCTELPGDVTRAPSELALGKKANQVAAQKRRGAQGTGAFPRVSFPERGSKA